MKRALALFGLIVAHCFNAPAAVSQDNDVRVELFAFAEFPFFSDMLYSGVRYPPITEYKVLKEWVGNPYNRIRSPDFFELVAIVANTSTLSIEEIELELRVDRRIGELWDFEAQPHPRETAQWEGLTRIETTMIGSLDGKMARVVRFGPFSASDLQDELVAQDLWPWEVQYEVTLRCNGCTPNTDSASIRMVHSL